MSSKATKQSLVNEWILSRVREKGQVKTWEIEQYFTLNPVIINGEQKKIMGSSALRYARWLENDGRILKADRHTYINAELF